MLIMYVICWKCKLVFPKMSEKKELIDFKTTLDFIVSASLQP